MKSTKETRGNEPVCRNGMANFDPTGSTDQSGPSRAGAECSGRREPKLTFPFDFRPKFRNSWHNGNQPEFVHSGFYDRVWSVKVGTF